MQFAVSNDFCRKLVENDSEAIAISESLNRVVRTISGKNSKFYRKIFLRRIPQPRQFFLNIGCSEEDINNLVNIEILRFVGHQDTLVSSLMIHRNLLDMEELNLNPSDSHPWFIATDWPDRIAKESVFPIHYESISLLRRLRGTGGEESSQTIADKKVLDIFCGSGILGIYAALSGAKSVVFADISERSLGFCRLNGILNKGSDENVNSVLDQITLVETDIFNNLNGLENRIFDLILANPPFEPAPDTFKDDYFFHSYGGPKGLEVVQPFLRDVTDHLSEKGKLFFVTFSLGDESFPIGMGKNEYIEREKKSKINLLNNNKLSGEMEILDSIPLRQFSLHLVSDKEKIRDSKDLDSWINDLQQESLTRVYLVIFELNKDNNPRIKVSRGFLPPYDWTVPLKVVSSVWLSNRYSKKN